MILQIISRHASHHLVRHFQWRNFKFWAPRKETNWALLFSVPMAKAKGACKLLCKKILTRILGPLGPRPPPPHCGVCGVTIYATATHLPFNHRQQSFSGRRLISGGCGTLSPSRTSRRRRRAVTDFFYWKRDSSLQSFLTPISCIASAVTSSFSDAVLSYLP